MNSNSDASNILKWSTHCCDRFRSLYFASLCSAAVWMVAFKCHFTQYRSYFVHLVSMQSKHSRDEKKKTPSHWTNYTISPIHQLNFNYDGILLRHYYTKSKWLFAQCSEIREISMRLNARNYFRMFVQRAAHLILAKFYKYTTLNKQTDWKIEIRGLCRLGFYTHMRNASTQLHISCEQYSQYAAAAASHFTYACCDPDASVYINHLLNRQRCLKTNTSKNTRKKQQQQQQQKQISIILCTQNANVSNATHLIASELDFFLYKFLLFFLFVSLDTALKESMHPLFFHSLYSHRLFACGGSFGLSYFC